MASVDNGTAKGAKPALMRDAFIDVIYEAAQKDRDLYFLSADFGAKALDAFRKELPKQFIHAGISEQNMVDVAAGLALSGKKVFLYAMAPFITARCYEQTKCVLASMRLPVTLIGVGVGLGYDHATLTHFTPEDLAAMKALPGLEVWTTADAEAAAALARRAIEKPAFRYVRLERVAQPAIYHGRFADVMGEGLSHVAQGADVCFVATGYMTHTALKARELLASRGVKAGVVDVFRNKPLAAEPLSKILRGYRAAVTIEEQMLEGGVGGSVAEAMADTGTMLPLRRLGLKDDFQAVNGDRRHLHKLYGLDAESAAGAAVSLLEASAVA